MSVFRRLKRQVSIKNISPVAKVVSVIKPTAKNVIDTKKVGIKDVVALSPIGLAGSLTNAGTSSIVDVVVDKPIMPVAEVESTTTPAVSTPAVSTPAVTTPAVTTPVVKKKPNTLMYAGIGVGVLVLGYLGYKFSKK